MLVRPNWWLKRAERPSRLDAGSKLALAADLDPSHVQGSLGAPTPSPDYNGVVIASRRGLLPEGVTLAARDVAGLAATALGLPA